MQKRPLSILLTMLLIGGLLVIASGAAFAAETESTEAGVEINPSGPGLVILLVGIAALGFVGFAYISRQHDDSEEQNG